MDLSSSDWAHAKSTYPYGSWNYWMTGDWLSDTVIDVMGYIDFLGSLTDMTMDDGGVSAQAQTANQRPTKTGIIIACIVCSIILGIPMLCLLSVFFRWIARKICRRWKQLAASGSARWERVRPQWPRRTAHNAGLELDPAVYWPTTAADQQRRLHLREKVLKNLARKESETSKPPSYDGFVEPPRPAMTTDGQRYNGYNV